MRNSAGMSKIHENIRTIHLEHYPCCTCTYGNYVYHMFLQSVDTTIHWIKWSWMNGLLCKEVRRWLRIINDFKHVLADNGFLFESFGIRLGHLTVLFFCEASCGARWTHHVQGFSVWLMLGQPSWMGFLKANNLKSVSGSYWWRYPQRGKFGKLIAWVYFYILHQHVISRNGEIFW